MSETRDIKDVLEEGIIRYSQVWEDYELLKQGLKIQSDDHILSIASAGCNALAMLLEEPASVTAVDLNPSQTAICHLKKAGYLHLTHEEFVSLVGVRKDHAVKDVYDKVKDALPEDARAFWDKNFALLEYGLVHCGRLEKYFRVFQEKFIKPLVPDEMMAQFLAQDGGGFQNEFFEKVFAHPKFVETFKQYTSRDMIAEHGRDESQFKFVEVEDVGEYFYERFKFVCTDLPTRHNFYMEFLMLSEYRDLEYGPAYLKPSNFEKLKSLMPRFHVVTKGLDACIDDFDKGHYSKANLSDLFEYLSEEQTQGFMRTLATGMRKGGRLAYWNLLVDRRCHESLYDVLKPHEAEAKALWMRDRAFFYSAFHLDEII